MEAALAVTLDLRPKNTVLCAPDEMAPDRSLRSAGCRPSGYFERLLNLVADSCHDTFRAGTRTRQLALRPMGGANIKYSEEI
jgi:hypothetical protein